MSSKHGRLRVETVRKTVEGKVYTTVLLRRSFRKDGKVQRETLGNLTRLPPDVIEKTHENAASALIVGFCEFGEYARQDSNL